MFSDNTIKDPLLNRVLLPIPPPYLHTHTHTDHTADDDPFSRVGHTLYNMYTSSPNRKTRCYDKTHISPNNI